MKNYYIGVIVKLNKRRANGYIRPLWAKTEDDNLFFHFSRGVPGKSFYKIDKQFLFTIENCEKEGRKHNKAVKVIIPMAVDLMAANQTCDSIVSEAMKITSRPKDVPDGKTLLKRRILIRGYNEYKDDLETDAILDEIVNNETDNIDLQNL